MIVLIKINYNLYMWKDNQSETEKMSEKRAIAFGLWTYKLNKSELIDAIENLHSDQNAAYFDNRVCIEIGKFK